MISIKLSVLDNNTLYIYIYIRGPILRYIFILSLDLQQTFFTYIYFYFFFAPTKNIFYTHTHTHIYIYIYIYIINVCCRPKERIKIYLKIGGRRDWYFFIYSFCPYIRVIYEYVSSLLFSSENMCGTRPFKWDTQWHLNSLLFAVWMLVMGFKYRSSSLFLRVCLP